MALSDDIGARGQALFFSMITRFCDRGRPLFSPCFLGDKFVGVDFLIELNDTGLSPCFFFVQVKATRQGYLIDDAPIKRLRVKVSQEHMDRLRSYPAPTYVVGIDERTEQGFIIAVDVQSPSQIKSLPTQYPLTCQNMTLLWDEVRDYWRKHDMKLKDSIFSIR